MTTKYKRKTYAKKPEVDYEQVVTDKIIAQLEKGVGAWSKSWSGSLPHNITTGVEYRGMNLIMLWLTAQEKGYESAGWITAKQAKDLGGYIRKGEKGTTIRIRKPFVVEEEKDGETVKKEIVSYKPWSVFNIAQTEGLDLEQVKHPIIKEAQDLLDGSCARVTPGEPAFSPSKDKITMPSINTFDSPDQYYSVAFHELTHWTGHKNRLARDLEGRFGDERYAREELVAELGSAFLSARCGLKGELRHAEYIKTWIKVLKEDKTAIKDAALEAQKAQCYIMDLALTHELDKQNKEEEELAM